MLVKMDSVAVTPTAEIGRRQMLKTGAVLGVAGLAGCTEDEPANFEVTDVDANDPVYRGSTADVGATIHNTGEQEATQTITLRVLGGDQHDSTGVTLDGDERTDVTFTAELAEADTGTLMFVVESDDDDERMNTTVERPLAVTDVSAEDGDGYITVTAEVENRAPFEASGVVVGEITSDAFDEPYTHQSRVVLDGGGTETVDLRIYYETDETVFMYSYDAWIEE